MTTSIWIYAVTIVTVIIVGTIVNWLADQLPYLSADPDASAGSGGVATSGLQRPNCNNCHSERSLIQYSALLSLLFGKSKCVKCGSVRSLRSLIVELFLILMSVYLLYVYGHIYGTILELYTCVFVLIAVIDIEHRLVLNVVMILAFIWSFIEIVVSHRIELGDALHGYAVGQLVVMGIYLLGIAYLWFVNSTRDEPITEVAFGFGDVTLATLCGLIVGYPNVVMMLVLMILLGGAISLLYIIFRMLVARDYRPHIPIAYGPAILIATFVVLLWSENITQWIYSR